MTAHILMALAWNSRKKNCNIYNIQNIVVVTEAYASAYKVEVLRKSIPFADYLKKIERTFDQMIEQRTVFESKKEF